MQVYIYFDSYKHIYLMTITYIRLELYCGINK